MLAMENVGEIQRLWYEEELTYREIEAELGVSSKTISKALNRPEEFVEGYRRKEAAWRPVIGPFEGRIEELLRGKAWAGGKRAKRTARWVYRQIRKEGYKGAESTVRAYVGERYRRSRPSCPIGYDPGEEVQFDFGKDTVKIGERVTLVHFMGATFGYSTRRQLFAYPAERQECLFDGIERTYQRAEGVSVRATLDNTTLAVSKILKGKDRKETDAYKAFRTMLGISPRFTNPGAAWEKGHAEGTVGWAKRQVLMDLEVTDWGHLQRVLDRECEEDARTRKHGDRGKLVQELYEEECQLMRPFPYEGRRGYKKLRPRVSKQGRIYVEGSRYSVPIGLRDRYVRVKLYWDEVVVTFDREEVARYERDWSGRGNQQKVEHYIPLLKTAPALLDHGEPFRTMPQWLKKTRKALRDDEEFVRLLLTVDEKKYGMQELELACEAAMEAGSVTVAVIEQRIVIGRGEDAERPQALREEECGELGQYEVRIEHPGVYDELLRAGEDEDTRQLSLYPQDGLEEASLEEGGEIDGDPRRIANRTEDASAVDDAR